MSSLRNLRFFYHAALAACASAMLIWANRGGPARLVSTQALSVPAEYARVAQENNAHQQPTGEMVGADNHHVGLTPVEAVRASLSVREILPQLGCEIADWRTYRPQTLVIAPHADLAMEFQMTSVRVENGRTIWHGRNALTGAFLVSVATQNDWHAVLDLPAAGSFEFQIAGQNGSVMEKNEPIRCGESPVASAADFAGEIAELAADSAETDDGDDDSSDKICTVDVLFFYDSATLAAGARSKATIETSIAARVEAANLVLENSRVKSFRWRFVAAYQVPEYSATGKLADDLGAITFTDKETGQFVQEKCTLHGVDQAMILVSGTRDYAGLAWVPSGGDSVAHHAAVTWDSSYTTMAHELAHNFGCRHDRRTENATDSDARTSYGFRFNFNGEDTGTVMSYAPNRVPYFSNPEVAFNGIALGVASGQPGAANNSRLLLEKAFLMTAYREACKKPIITDQPQGATVTRGNNLTLKVAAVGEGLTYQWRKSGSAIAGATSATFAKSGTSDADAGTYDVLVSNESGEAVSASASVVVASPATDTNAQAATSGQSQGQSSGGGGGAPSDWFFAVLALLGAARLISQRRSGAAV